MENNIEYTAKDTQEMTEVPQKCPYVLYTVLNVIASVCLSFVPGLLGVVFAGQMNKAFISQDYAAFFKYKRYSKICIVVSYTLLALEIVAILLLVVFAANMGILSLNNTQVFMPR